MIKVLIVDDSLFMRQLVAELCKGDPELEVAGKAKSGEEALGLLPQIKPDVITLDLEMPGMGGLATLKKIMTTYPTPVVILSAYSREGADVTIECLEEGAVSFVLKPSGEMSLDIAKVKDKLLAEIRAAAGANLMSFPRHHKGTASPKRESRMTSDQQRIIVIGASTGGPRMLEIICSALPSDFPIPVIVVLHMPSQVFTQSLARRFNDLCALEVKEAEHHESLYPGFIYLAPGGHQLSLEARKKEILASVPPCFVLHKAKPDELSPSIDITMKSTAELYGETSIGVILTGMGQDGLEGMQHIKAAGGQTIVQDEASSLIFGMPKAVIDKGYADYVLPMGEMGGFLEELINSRPRTSKFMEEIGV
jgi:two-component system, chemotaxis family, protein-glutamate methylesterase/glutaminase